MYCIYSKRWNIGNKEPDFERKLRNAYPCFQNDSNVQIWDVHYQYPNDHSVYVG